MSRSIRTLGVSLALAAGLTMATAAPAGACAGLVTPGGNVRLLRTATLAAYHDGLEHYVTSFQFSGGGAEFGSIVPLPAIPSKVERGGDWTLQRLDRETKPQVAFARASSGAAAESSDAEVVYETRIDALDITILKGGGKAVGDWAREHGFRLTPDAPEVLDFYAQRSKIFMAARFDAAAAQERGQQVGDGTPIHLTIPTKNPWVPLRILGLGRDGEENIDADVYLLTARRPSLLPKPAPLGTFDGRTMQIDHDAAARPELLNDLRSDKGMEWVPASMHLTSIQIRGAARTLHHDLSIDALGRGRTSYRAAGLTPPAPPPTTTTTAAPTTTTAAPTTTTETPTTAPPTSLVAAPPVSSDGWGLASTATATGSGLALLAIATGVVVTFRRRRVVAGDGS